MAFDTHPGERISRFLTDRKKFNPTTNTVKHAAYFPPKNRQLSVYWSSGLPEAEIWDIGDTHVAPSRGPILGRADVNSQVAYAASLEVRVTGVPHPKHADVIGWDHDQQKMRLQAMQLADKSTLQIKP